MILTILWITIMVDCTDEKVVSLPEIKNNIARCNLWNTAQWLSRSNMETFNSKAAKNI